MVEPLVNVRNEHKTLKLYVQELVSQSKHCHIFRTSCKSFLTRMQVKEQPAGSHLCLLPFAVSFLSFPSTFVCLESAMKMHSLLFRNYMDCTKMLCIAKNFFFLSFLSFCLSCFLLLFLSDGLSDCLTDWLTDRHIQPSFKLVTKQWVHLYCILHVN